jgi:hypothetical protein
MVKVVERMAGNIPTLDKSRRLIPPQIFCYTSLQNGGAAWLTGM